MDIAENIARQIEAHNSEIDAIISGLRACETSPDHRKLVANDPDEAEKRMYYVAFARAIKSVLIVAFDTEKFSALEMKYDSLVKQLAGSPIYQADDGDDADTAADTKEAIANEVIASYEQATAALKENFAKKGGEKTTKAS